MSGTQIIFKAPVHNHDRIQPISPRTDSVNLYNASVFHRMPGEDKTQPASLGFVNKWWRFRALPLLNGTGVLGDVNFLVTIEHLPEFSSLFRPRRFECAIERIIYRSSEAYRIPGECRLDWEVRTVNGMQWVMYRSLGYSAIRNAEESYEYVCHTAISDEHILTFRFDMVIRKTKTELVKVFKELVDNVLESIDVQLSEAEHQNKVTVEQQYPWEKVSKSLEGYQFEDPILLSDWDMAGKISAKYNHERKYEDIEAEIDESLKKQVKNAKKIKQTILASHLLFETLEFEDYQRAHPPCETQN